MTLNDQISQYTTLLKIRQNARRRDAFITGGIFLISVLVTLALGLLGEIQGRSVYILAGLVAAFGLSYMMMWVRLEVIKSSLELADYLQREGRHNS